MGVLPVNVYICIVELHQLVSFMRQGLFGRIYRILLGWSMHDIELGSDGNWADVVDGTDCIHVFSPVLPTAVQVPRPICV